MDCSAHLTDNVCSVFVVAFVISFYRVCVDIKFKYSSSSDSFYDKLRFVSCIVFTGKCDERNNV